MKWNSLDIIKFLAIYEHFPLLWNFRIYPQPQNIHTKDSEFARLSSELKIAGLLGDMTDKQLKAKIKCIKDVLRQELVKVHKSALSSVDGKDIYRPKLAWFDSAEFLREIMSTSGPRRLEQTHPQEKIEFVGIEEQDVLQENPLKRTLDITPITTLQKIKKLKQMLPSEIQNSPTSTTSTLSIENPKSEDVHDQFGKYIACELRSLPNREAILVKQEIQNIITKAHLSLCQPQTVNQYDYNPIEYVSPSYSHSSGSECEEKPIINIIELNK